MTEPTIKDSGAREGYAGGMVRDTEEGKIDWTNLYFGPMARRWAIHTTKGRAKYNDPEPGIPNWSLGLDLAVWLRARRSFLRHEKAWLAGMKDEDHAAGMFFNVNLKEFIEERLSPADRVAARNIERLHAAALDFPTTPEPTPEVMLTPERMRQVLELPDEAIKERYARAGEPWGECGKTCSGRRCFDSGCQGDNPNFQLQAPEQTEDLPHEAGDTGDIPNGLYTQRGRDLLERARTPLAQSVADDLSILDVPRGANLTPAGDDAGESRGAVMRRELAERGTLGDPDE